MKCEVLECEEEAIIGNRFCQKHKNGIECLCFSCSKKIIIKPKNYDINKIYYCRSCSSKENILKFNNSKEAKKVRSKNMKKYNTTPEAKENRNKGLKKIHEEYTGSKKHIRQISQLGLKMAKQRNNNS